MRTATASGAVVALLGKFAVYGVRSIDTGTDDDHEPFCVPCNYVGRASPRSSAREAWRSHERSKGHRYRTRKDAYAA